MKAKNDFQAQRDVLRSLGEGGPGSTRWGQHTAAAANSVNKFGSAVAAERKQIVKNIKNDKKYLGKTLGVLLGKKQIATLKDKVARQTHAKAKAKAAENRDIKMATNPAGYQRKYQNLEKKVTGRAVGYAIAVNRGSQKAVPKLAKWNKRIGKVRGQMPPSMTANPKWKVKATNEGKR